MFCPPTLTKIPSGQPGSPGLNGGFLHSLEFLARTWQHGESQSVLGPSYSSPFSSPFQQGSPAHTSKSFPAPQHLLLVDLLSLGCHIPTLKSLLEGMTWTRPALGLGASMGMSGQRILGSHALFKRKGCHVVCS